MKAEVGTGTGSQTGTKGTGLNMNLNEGYHVRKNVTTTPSSFYATLKMNKN